MAVRDFGIDGGDDEDDTPKKKASEHGGRAAPSPPVVRVNIVGLEAALLATSEFGQMGVTLL
jgi:hypothetical protein